MTLRRDMRADDRAAALRAMGVKTNVPTSSTAIDTAMLGVIKECLRQGKPIERQDFLRVLVPAGEIEPRFPRLLAQARRSRGRSA